MSYWTSMPINEMFTINDQMVGQGLNQILSGQLANQQAKQAQERRESEEEAQKEKEKKEKEERDAAERGTVNNTDQGISESDKLKKIFEDFSTQAENVNNVYGELNNLSTPPNISALSDMQRQIKELKDTYARSESTLNGNIIKLENR